MESASDGPGSHQRPLTRLAPAPPGGSGEGASAAGARPRTRRQVTAACEACRRRKSKCNAERPQCNLCVRHGTDCRYATAPTETHSQALKRKNSELQNRITPYQELFDLLQTKSETESLEIWRRIRTGNDVNSILRHTRDGDLLIQLSLVPEARRRYEFPYVPDMPPSILAPDNLYLRSFVYETTFRAPPSHGFEHDSQRQGYGDDRYLKPYHAAQVVEPNFENLTISKWTSVTSDEHLLKKLLYSYLFYQHPWTAAFHMDYFLEDMESGNTRFCSSLLVNSALAAACHMCREIPDRDKFWIPQSLSYQFLAEAKRLWEVESRTGVNRLTAIQAAVLLSIVSLTTARDKQGKSYLLQAIAMATNLDLFSATAGTEDEKIRRARAFTAWGLYCWQAWQRFYFTLPPFIRDPPAYPLPDPTLDPEWYGEIWIRYPLSQKIFPINVGCIVKSNFDLRKLMNDMAAELFEEDEPPLVTAEKILDCKSRLDMWFTELPEPLTPTKVVFPDHIKIHLEYYGTIISLVRLLAQSGTILDITWQNIITHAEVRLETLLRLYYLRHSYESYDPLLMHWLTFLGDTMLQKLNSADGGPAAMSFRELESLRSTLILCAKGLYDQGRNYHIAVLVYRLLRDRMKANDVDLVRTHLFSTSPSDPTSSKNDDDPPLMMEYVEAQWLAPVSAESSGPARKTLDYLLREYEKLSLEQNVDDVGDLSGSADA
ncbi:hypothetical protein GGR54DRAFT_628061 [Hypoxylon sp. NC1633]|nr:hypothetical protein GGR54DRAFT_628061 [Hypoxylon sp. NC1633]